MNPEAGRTTSNPLSLEAGRIFLAFSSLSPWPLAVTAMAWDAPGTSCKLVPDPPQLSYLSHS